MHELYKLYMEDFLVNLIQSIKQKSLVPRVLEQIHWVIQEDNVCNTS